jgi:glycosyltransferase involved in cell wall biosynthesis
VGDSPLVSVILPAHGERAQLLRRALASVGAQGYRPVELVVIDDGCSEATAAVIVEMRSELEGRGIAFETRRLVGTPPGPAVARNVGLELAGGSYIALLDSDDYWEPGLVTALTALFARQPECAVAFCGNFEHDEDGRVARVRPMGLAGDGEEGRLARPLDQFMTIFPFQTSAALVRRSALDQVGRFDETLALWSDADLWYRLAEQFDFAYLREPLSHFQNHGANITNGRLTGGSDWFLYQALVSLRYLDDVRDPVARQVVIERITRSQLLLQRKLLRSGERDPAIQRVVDERVGTVPLRLRIGGRVLGLPLWFGRGYATAETYGGRVAALVRTSQR